MGSWASLGESLGSFLGQADRGDMARSSRNSDYSGDRIGPAHPTGRMMSLLTTLLFPKRNYILVLGKQTQNKGQGTKDELKRNLGTSPFLSHLVFSISVIHKGHGTVV